MHDLRISTPPEAASPVPLPAMIDSAQARAQTNTNPPQSASRYLDLSIPFMT